MAIEPTLATFLEMIFAPLNRKAAIHSFPVVRSLADKLESVLPPGDGDTRYVDQPTATCFATAAVDLWLRAVHSFLISAALTDASPIWSSVAGYYSSHYSVRALAHLLGVFKLHSKKRVVQLELRKGRYVCTFSRKGGGDREHNFYWAVVKRSPSFADDPWFRLNDSEVLYRDRANYVDHVGRLPNFRSLTLDELKRRIEIISQMRFDAPPIPLISECPDPTSIQVLAYHRLVSFRRFLDETVSPGNRFWNVHRTPSWTQNIVDFQLVEQGGLQSLH
jgi:hypothetical protein